MLSDFKDCCRKLAKSMKMWSYSSAYVCIIYNETIENITYSELRKQNIEIGQLHDDVILLQLPESLSVLFSCVN